MTLDIAQFVLPILLYVAGFLTGFFTRNIIRDKSINNGVFVLVIVTIMWTVSMLFDIASPEYQTPTLVHGLMGAIVGFFYKPLQQKE